MLGDPNTLIYASDKYRRLLRKHLNADDYYLVALNEKNKIVGALPTFIKRNNNYGNIINSLPFYGSNGGIIEYCGDINVRCALLEAFNNLAQKEGCVASTIITSPFEGNLNLYKEKTQYSFF